MGPFDSHLGLMVALGVDALAFGLVAPAMGVVGGTFSEPFFCVFARSKERLTIILISSCDISTTPSAVFTL
jgi:hypothetical protein